MTPVPTSRKRIVFLDWLRGLAALIMLQGHTFHSFTQPEFREHGFYKYSQFFGGEAAAVFLFVTGITYGLGMAKRQDLPPLQRLFAALKRARYLFLIGIAFRLQMFIFGFKGARVTDLLIVDILNLMGFAAAMLAFVALAGGAMQRVRWATYAGILIAALAPLVTDLDTSGVPKFIRDYIVPGASFSMFPWGSYLAFGLALGNAIPLVPAGNWGRVMQWATLAGLGLIVVGRYASDLDFSVYPSAEFWVDSPGLVACKMGALFLMGAVAYLWTEYLSPGGFSWVRLLGTTSLPVYWVHVELVYGWEFYSWHGKLTPWQSLYASAVLIVLMIGMSLAIKRLPWRQWFANLPSKGATLVRSRPAA